MANGAGGVRGSRTTWRTGRWWRLHGLSVAVVVLGLSATGALTGASHVNYLDNEQRLTTLEARLTGDALGVATVDVERRLGPAVVLAAYGGSPAAFEQSLAGSVGAKGPFVGVELLRLEGGVPASVVALGARLLQGTTSAGSLALVHRAVAGAGQLALSRVERTGSQRFAYAMAATGPAGTFVAYAEQLLPADRRVALPASSPIANLRFALYMGGRATPAALVETDSARLPLSGTTATVHVLFGDAELTLVVVPRGSLAGTFAESVAWWIAGVGVVLTLAVLVLVERLVRRRRQAEVLAAQNERLYRAQRGVAETLQHSLLPARLPRRREVEVAARYLPGARDVEVGGDWYDVVRVDDRHLFFTVGDVSGRGLEAAVVMASLRNAVTAYAADGAAPDEVLTKLGRLLDVGADGRFATVACGLLDARTGRVVIADAGHPPPVLVEGRSCRPIDVRHGALLGMGGPYVPVELSLTPGATVLAYTDGLIERRGEPLDVGLQRLCAAASRDLPLEQLLEHVVAELVGTGPADDVAVLGLRWRP